MSASVATIAANTALMYLANKNPHLRDERISFQEEGHTYTIDGVDAKRCANPYTSVTTLVHQQFEPFDADKIIAKMMASPKWSKNKYFGTPLTNRVEINRPSLPNLYNAIRKFKKKSRTRLANHEF